MRSVLLRERVQNIGSLRTALNCSEIKMKRHNISSLLLIFLVMVPLLDLTLAESVIVSTDYGDIRGTLMAAPAMVASAIKNINQFTGIPFAAPPVGELRFKPPKPPQAWKPNVYDATKFEKVCIQEQNWLDIRMKPFFPGFGRANYSEDCLYLNVYAPAQNDSLSPTTEYPVMVYIHGGAFTSGTALLSPGLVLPTYGVVLVTIQYRLGPFGFLSTGDSNSPGNYGMLDQVLALKWVNENIKNFGGDPNKVTIFGFSAGGASVGLHLLSPLSKGLFQAAISESGVDLSPWSTIQKAIAVTHTLELAKKVGCNGKIHNKILECLKTKDAWTISNVAGELWSPTVDSEAGADAYLPDTPQHLRQAGKFQKVPYMVGFVPNEAAYFFPHLGNVSINLAIFKNALQVLAVFGLNVTKDKELIGMVQNALEFQYTPWGNTDDSTKLRQSIVDSNSDRSFLASSILACIIHSTHAPSYLYEFGYHTNSSLPPALPKWMGVTHGANFQFDFGVPFLNMTGLPQYNDADKNVSYLVMRMFTNFAKLGNPTPEPLSNGVQWTAFNLSNLAYLHIDISQKLRKNFEPHRIAFWNEYYPKLVTSAPLCNMSRDKPYLKGGAKSVCPHLALTVYLALKAMISAFCWTAAE